MAIVKKEGSSNMGITKPFKMPYSSTIYSEE
jgi:hypothetical protein